MMDQLPAEALDDRELVKVEAMIQSMTRQERSRPDLINESRIRRIARGCGRNANDVRDLHKRFLMARHAMRQIGQATGLFGSLKQGRRARALLGGGGGEGLGALFGGGAQEPEAPRMSYEEKIARHKKQKDERRARKKNQKKK
jgi:hypothetical protein